MMKRKVISAFLLLIFTFSMIVNTTYAKKYEHEYDHTYRYYRYESFKPLIWAGAVYVGIIAVKELIFIPEEKIVKKKEIELIQLEVERKKKELEFLYNPPPGWDTTPRGMKFLRNLSTKYYFEE